MFKVPTLTWKCMFGLRREKDMIPSPCCKPDTSLHVCLLVHSSFIRGSLILTGHICILEICKVCGRHLFSIVSVQGSSVCVHTEVWEGFYQSVNLLLHHVWPSVTSNKRHQELQVRRAAVIPQWNFQTSSKRLESIMIQIINHKCYLLLITLNHYLIYER